MQRKRDITASESQYQCKKIIYLDPMMTIESKRQKQNQKLWQIQK